MSVITLYPTNEAPVDAFFPNNNFGYLPYGILGCAPSSPGVDGPQRTWYGFDTSSIPVNARISSAYFNYILYLFYPGSFYGKLGFDVQQYYETVWEQSRITWNNAYNDDVDERISTSFYHEFYVNTENLIYPNPLDLTFDVQRAFRSGHVAWRMKAQTENNSYGCFLAGTRWWTGWNQQYYYTPPHPNAPHQPSLVVTYTTPRRAWTTFSGLFA